MIDEILEAAAGLINSNNSTIELSRGDIVSLFKTANDMNKCHIAKTFRSSKQDGLLITISKTSAKYSCTVVYRKVDSKNDVSTKNTTTKKLNFDLNSSIE